MVKASEGAFNQLARKKASKAWPYRKLAVNFAVWRLGAYTSKDDDDYNK